MQANFADTLKPYLAITNVTSGMLWTNPTYTVMGVATDDEAMATVNFSFNGVGLTRGESPTASTGPTGLKQALTARHKHFLRLCAGHQ